MTLFAGGPLPERTIADLLEQIETMLRADDVEVRTVHGVEWVENKATGAYEAQGTTGRTLTIKVNGGARDEG